MAKVATHKQVYRKGALGTVNTTLCGRMSNAGDEMNVSDDAGEKVTCKFCLKILADKTHWRNRNIVEAA